MGKIRTLIIDDEELARERLRSLLSREADLELVGEAADGQSALDAILAKKPDLIFLDVQMPELDGFQVLEALPERSRPSVIFVTAHDQFALRAFDVHAVDYLLKPFDRSRLQTALHRALEKIRSRAPAPELEAVIREARPAPRPLDRLLVKTEGRVLLVKADEIDWIEAADNYVEIHAGTETHLMRETLTSLETRLPADKFMRISRSVIVNLEKIKELQPMFHGEYVVILRNGVKLTLSRGYREKLDHLMGSGS